MPKNPSELARLEAELEYAKRRLFEGFHSKSTKQYILNEIHDLERKLGLELTQYNGKGSI
jgi:hypothetical protein